MKMLKERDIEEERERGRERERKKWKKLRRTKKPINIPQLYLFLRMITITF